MQKSNQNEKMNISQVREKISQLFQNLYDDQDKRIVVEKSGIVMGAVVSPLDLMRLTQLDKKREEALNFIGEMRSGFKDQTEEEILENAVRAVREVRTKSNEELHDNKD